MYRVSDETPDFALDPLGPHKGGLDSKWYPSLAPLAFVEGSNVSA
jgi:hypothetical protein